MRVRRRSRRERAALCGHSDHRYALQREKPLRKMQAQEIIYTQPTRHQHRGRQAPLQINAFACVLSGAGRTPEQSVFLITQRVLWVYFYSKGMWANHTTTMCVLLIRSRVLHFCVMGTGDSVIHCWRLPQKSVCFYTRYSKNT